MVIKGTSRIRGVLDLNSIKQQIGKDDSIPISDNDFWNSDVQIAINMGYITAVGDATAPELDGELDRVVKLVNKLRTPLNIPNQTHSISPGAQFTLRESELQTPDIKQAISKGLIQILNVIKEENATEGFVSLEASAEATEDAQADADADFANELTPAQRALRSAMQNQAADQAPPAMETNEEMPEPKVEMAAHFIATDKPDGIKATDIPDSLGKSVVFNPTGAKPINIIKNASVTNPKSEVRFVDDDQEQERIENHPTLKPKKKDELDLLDLEDVGTRKNPNLNESTPMKGI